MPLLAIYLRYQNFFEKYFWSKKNYGHQLLRGVTPFKKSPACLK